MKYSLLSLTFCFASLLTTAQTKPYFQQKVDYNIKVKLDDSRQMLQAHIDIRYQNNAPEALEVLYIHLWPNAYKDNNTVFAKAEARSGSWSFYNAPDEKRGFIDSLDFEVNGQQVRWELLSDTIDVARVYLASPLQPGQSLQLSTPFRVKVPGNFSRLGFARNQYQLCQWYPKPAVYDRDGWHYMPYLNMGEFYSEFGDFDVYITVPDNFQVAASGNLQTASEIAYLDSLAAYAAGLDSFPTLPNPESSSSYKSLHYRLQNAHDFAWFCGKNYYVKQSEVALPHSGRKVKTSVFFSRETDLWKDATTYVDSSVYYYSLWLGDYPYDVCTAVDGALTAGGGMEYPTITVIAGAGSAEMLDLVIAHEVGHNWFYGILASNERDHPFLDEGFNSFYESRYMALRYPGQSPEIGGLSRIIGNPDLDMLAWLFSRKRGKDRSLWHSHATDYDLETYGTLVYKRTAVELKYLEAYLGREEFDRLLQHYYESWKFRHPGPDDMRLSLLKAGPEKPIEWWFEQRLQRVGRLDYRLGPPLKSADGWRLSVKSKGDALPYPIHALDTAGQILATYWQSGHNCRRMLDLPDLPGLAAWSIDPESRMPLYMRPRTEVSIRQKAPALPALRPVLGLAFDRHKAFVLPVMGLNDGDGYMLGMGLYSPILVPQDLEYAVLPMWAFGSQQITGEAMIRYNWHRESGLIKSWQLGSSIQRYGNFRPIAGYAASTVTHLRLQAKLRDTELSARSRVFRFTASRVPWDQSFGFLLPAFRENNLWLGRANYTQAYKRLRNPWSFGLELEGGSRQNDQGWSAANVRLSGELNHRWYYLTGKNKGAIDQRFFAGVAYMGDVNNPLGFNTYGGAVNGAADYRFDEIFLNRSRAMGQINRIQQVTLRDAGFRSPMDFMALNLMRVSTTPSLAAYNFGFHVPRLPLEIYANAAYTTERLSLPRPPGFGPGVVLPNGFLYEAGIAISVFGGNIRLNYNLLQAPILRPNWSDPGRNVAWYEYLSWSINLRKLNPYDIVRNLNF
jgi:hypothetical protein